MFSRATDEVSDFNTKSGIGLRITLRKDLSERIFRAVVRD